MPYLILHEHPSQDGRCLESLVRYAERIPIRFDTMEAITLFLREQPFESDRGILESAVPVKDYQLSACTPWQRQRIWPAFFNCWEATAHWLAHALKLLHSDEIVEIWDRDLRNGVRHVWPTLKRSDGIWLVAIEGKQGGNHRKINTTAANFGWGDVFGALHTAGAGVLGFFLGSDRASPIVQEAEKAWGNNIADWAKSGKSAARAGESIARYASYNPGGSEQKAKTTSDGPKPSRESDKRSDKSSMDFDNV